MVSPPFDPMQAIWEGIATREPDGKRFIKWADQGDLEYLYEQGFVDTDKYTSAEWIESFRESRQPDGTYTVTEAQWLAKRTYRYEGPTEEPFNPLSIREGEWTPEDLQELIDTKLIPSTSLKKDNFAKMLEKGREMGRFVNGKYIVNKPFKFGMKQLLDTYPSPRRRRELAVLEATEKLSGKNKAAASPVTSKTISTGYSTGPAVDKTAADQLSQLLWKGKK